MRLAVIPARGGSKRIPRKNVKLFCGKPIIAWSIEAALESECFDKVVVSTDDTEIADVSLSWGAEVPFWRPEHLADDYAGTMSVIAHAIDWYIHRGTTPEYVCCIYATAPLMFSRDLQRGLSALMQTNSDFAFAVTPYSYPIQRALRINASFRTEMFYPEEFSTRSQDLEDAYHDAGQFYWGRADAWKQSATLFSPNSTPVILPIDRVLDIDTPEDWVLAEKLFRITQGKRV